jgi:hypothetical protein
MQKVVGSSPIIRSYEAPAQVAFLLAESATLGRGRGRFCRRFTSIPPSVRHSTLPVQRETLAELLRLRGPLLGHVSGQAYWQRTRNWSTLAVTSPGSGWPLPFVSLQVMCESVKTVCRTIT